MNPKASVHAWRYVAGVPVLALALALAPAPSAAQSMTATARPVVTVCVEPRDSGVTYRYVVHNEGRARSRIFVIGLGIPPGATGSGFSVTLPRADSAYARAHWTLRSDGQDNAVGRLTRVPCPPR